jgi:hypothetical protein
MLLFTTAFAGSTIKLGTMKTPKGAVPTSAYPSIRKGKTVVYFDNDRIRTIKTPEGYHVSSTYPSVKAGRTVVFFERDGVLIKIEDYHHVVGHCYRCKTIVEPNLSLQWFVKTKPLAKAGIEAVREGRTRIIPEVWEKTYFKTRGK